jgi:hypothetical protein
MMRVFPENMHDEGHSRKAYLMSHSRKAYMIRVIPEKHA